MKKLFILFLLSSCANEAYIYRPGDTVTAPNGKHYVIVSKQHRGHQAFYQAMNNGQIVNWLPQKSIK